MTKLLYNILISFIIVFFIIVGYGMVIGLDINTSTLSSTDTPFDWLSVITGTLLALIILL